MMTNKIKMAHLTSSITWRRSREGRPRLKSTFLLSKSPFFWEGLRLRGPDLLLIIVIIILIDIIIIVVMIIIIIMFIIIMVKYVSDPVVKVIPEQELVEAKRLDPEWIGGRARPVHIQYYDIHTQLLMLMTLTIVMMKAMTMTMK